MFVGRLAKFIRRQDWAAVLLEILVVMVGLVAAFQVDRWWEARRARLEEREYVARLIADVGIDIPALEYAVSLAEVRLGFGDLLAEVAKEPSVAMGRPAHFLAAVSQAAFTYTPSLASHTFDDLRSTGNLKLIRDKGVTRALHDYYEFDQAQRQFVSLNLMIEHRYFELSAGILSLEQYKFVQDGWHVVNAQKLPELRDARPNEEEVRAAAERLRADAELVAWLPKVRGVQVDQIMAHKRRLENARSLLGTLQDYEAGFGDQPARAPGEQAE